MLGIADFISDVARGGARMLSGVPDTLLDKLLGGMFVTGPTTKAGVNVTQATALTYSAVWAATRILTEALMMSPQFLFKGQRNQEGRTRDRDHSLYKIIHDSPNPEMDACAFWGQQTPGLINAGNSYAKIERGIMGNVIALWPLRTQDVRCRRRDDGIIEYEIRNEHGRLLETIPRRDEFGRHNILHIAGAISPDGIVGRGVITQARESIGAAQAGQQYHSGLLDNGGVPSGLLTRPEGATPLDEKAERLFLQTWNEQFAGSNNAGKTAHLQEGYNFTPIFISPADAQFLESQRFSIAEIARWYVLPVHVLAESAGATRSSISAENTALIGRSVQPWATKMEKAESFQLLSETEKTTHFIELNLDAQMRGDPEARAKVNRLDIMHGKRTVNQVKALDNLEPVEGGDTTFVPSNIVPIEKAIADDPPPPETVPDMPTPAQEEQDQGQQGVAAVPGIALATAEDLESLRLDLAAMPTHQDITDLRAQISDEHEASDERKARTIDAAREVIFDAASRMLTKESNAAKRAAGKQKTFLSWMDSFYDDHLLVFGRAIKPGVVTLLSAAPGERENPLIHGRLIANDSIEESRRLLLEAAECQPDDLLDRVTECVANWPTERRRIALPELGATS